VNISTLRKVTSLRQAGARDPPVSVNHAPGVRGGQRGRGQRILVDDRDHARRLALEPGQPVGVEQLPEPGDEVRPDQGAEVVMPADQRDLADDRLNPAVDCRDDQDVAT
jgi:hypothetical protein